jgi:hypothetical protein
MNKKGRKPVSKEQSLEEQAINHKESEGRKVNPQEQQRKEQHQPRDTA